LTAFDLNITFQKATEKATEYAPGTVGVIDLVTISMSPQHFKGFLRAAQESLSAYENTFGTLTISDEDTAPTRNAAQIEESVQAARTAHRGQSTSSNEPQQPSEQPAGAPRRKGKQP
jgi:hypothetical protein